MIIRKFEKQIILLLLTLLLVACGGQEPLASAGAPTALPVEYGASLDEWQASQGSDVAEPIAVQETAVVPPTVAPSPTTVVEIANASTSPQTALPNTNGKMIYQELSWEDLMSPDFTPAAIMEKYQDELAKFQDGDPEAMALYRQMQDEMSNAPTNETLNETLIRLPGFIAPLDYTGELITEFLLVPYFGACIHVPAPPANQTVLVKTAAGYGIKPADAFAPIWIAGLLTTQEATTDLADAGYYVQDAVIEPYTYEP